MDSPTKHMRKRASSCDGHDRVAKHACKRAAAASTGMPARAAATSTQFCATSGTPGARASMTVLPYDAAWLGSGSSSGRGVTSGYVLCPMCQGRAATKHFACGRGLRMHLNAKHANSNERFTTDNKPLLKN